MRRTAALLLACSLAACADKADRAAKERIFSPEEPAEDLRRAQEKIPAKDLATDAGAFTRVMTMDRLEAARRLGGHKATTQLTFRWTRAGRTVTLAEKHELSTDQAGQFRAVSTNDQDSGLEVVYVDGRAYVKSRYGPFRARRMDRAQQDAWRDKATPALSELHALFQGRLKVSPLGPAPKAGRPALKYAFLLGEAPAGGGERRDLPPVSYGQWRDPAEDKLKPGPDPDTARRLDFESRRVPEKVSGELYVDEATGVVLAATAKARFAVPGLATEPPAALDLDVSFEAVPEASVKISVPDDVTQARLAHAVNNPLWFMGDGPAPAKFEEDEPAGADTAEAATDDDDGAAPKDAAPPKDAPKDEKKAAKPAATPAKDKKQP